MGKSIIAKWVYKNCPIIVSQKVTSVDIVELEMTDFDIILGIDWLYSCYALVSYRNRVIQFYFPNEPVIELRGSTLVLRPDYFLS